MTDELRAFRAAQEDALLLGDGWVHVRRMPGENTLLVERLDPDQYSVQLKLVSEQQAERTGMMVPTLFFEWLARTHELQTKGYGYELPMGDGDPRAIYFVQQAFAAVCELAEMAGEIGWKPWGTDRTIDRPKFLKEGVDLLHFVGNLLVMAGCTDVELNALYWAKIRVNYERAASGTYNGRTEGKCPGCKRDLNEVEIVSNSSEAGTFTYCGACTYLLSEDRIR